MTCNSIPMTSNSVRMTSNSIHTPGAGIAALSQCKEFPQICAVSDISYNEDIVVIKREGTMRAH